MNSLCHGPIFLSLVRGMNYAHHVGGVSEEKSYSHTQANLNRLRTVLSHAFLISEMLAYIHENYQYIQGKEIEFMIDE